MTKLRMLRGAVLSAGIVAGLLGSVALAPSANASRTGMEWLRPHRPSSGVRAGLRCGRPSRERVTPATTLLLCPGRGRRLAHARVRGPSALVAATLITIVVRDRLLDSNGGPRPCRRVGRSRKAPFMGESK
jgi:hypothetical protein